MTVFDPRNTFCYNPKIYNWYVVIAAFVLVKGLQFPGPVDVAVNHYLKTVSQSRTGKVGTICSVFDRFIVISRECTCLALAQCKYLPFIVRFSVAKPKCYVIDQGSAIFQTKNVAHLGQFLTTR